MFEGRLGFFSTPNVKNNVQNLFGGPTFMTINGRVPTISFQNLHRLAIQSDKKMKGPTLFKLSQHHINNWEVGKLFLQTTIFSLSMSNLFRYG
jgi:hypothetical protein